MKQTAGSVTLILSISSLNSCSQLQLLEHGEKILGINGHFYNYKGKTQSQIN